MIYRQNRNREYYNNIMIYRQNINNQNRECVSINNKSKNWTHWWIAFQLGIDKYNYKCRK